MEPRTNKPLETSGRRSGSRRQEAVFDRLSLGPPSAPAATLHHTLRDTLRDTLHAALALLVRLSSRRLCSVVPTKGAH